MSNELEELGVMREMFDEVRRIAGGCLVLVAVIVLPWLFIGAVVQLLTGWPL